MKQTMKCGGCRKVRHDRNQWACDKCMAVGTLQDAINVAQTALNAIKEKWNMTDMDNK